MREVRTTYYRPIGCIELDNVSVAGTAAWIWMRGTHVNCSRSTTPVYLSLARESRSSAFHGVSIIRYTHGTARKLRHVCNVRSHARKMDCSVGWMLRASRFLEKNTKAIIRGHPPALEHHFSYQVPPSTSEMSPTSGIQRLSCQSTHPFATSGSCLTNVSAAP